MDRTHFTDRLRLIADDLNNIRDFILASPAQEPDRFHRDENDF